ncbi:poly-beta-1,6 N-acetyl-D-glucosamine export porin PgaA [Pseudoxanthomonas taiwanensis]|uniref:Poly-beta-1,6 N-acetyl-D-glucosamine export porin PgaA n=1 Tax=Pseudoxanthomonas taiwanensis TaxID=176598 RepID=A0A921NT36_9GAMM|nr:poly-beta-1,6 N-acetyl-D-glucosamine export porin PgaA [Pseudoxanthomonas taiwanensis]KAF1689079.1 poly-beta-1,6 N-acetyl-D-glucosamine export porin PgaA [Pseudoxanthomonas taiwanensis]
MPSPSPLALCVAIACAGIPGLGVAQTPPPTSAPPTAEDVWRLRDGRQWYAALSTLERAAAHAPDDPGLYKLRALLLADIGSGYRAWTLYQARPELFDADEREWLEARRLGRMVTWSEAQGASDETRLDDARAAEAAIETYLRTQHPDGRDVPLSVRFDRLIVLNELGEHQRVVDEYESMRREGVDVPDYVLPAIGESLLVLQRPREAAGVLEKALQTAPENSVLRTQLAFAQLEYERPDLALAQLQAYAARQPPWVYERGARNPYENWGRYDADVTHAMISAYSGYLPQAQSELEALATVGPANGGLHTSLGEVFMMRGWPERALERFRMAQTLDERDVGARIGQVDALMALQRDDLAAPLRDHLLRYYPGQPAVMRMDRAWRVHRGWQWRAYASIGRSDDNDRADSSPLGSRDGRYGVEVQTPILDDRWRLTASADDRWAEFDGERIHHRTQSVGVRYAFDRLDAHLAASHADDRVGGTGIDLAVGWRFNDQWSAATNARRNDPDASLQARAAGITADSVGATMNYARDERFAWNLGVTRFRYDDGNVRTAFSAGLDQRVLTRPHFLLDASLGAYASRGTRDDAPYFNPSRDGSLELGLRADHLAWRHYERHFRHRLTASIGPYWQERFGSAWVPSLRYEHEWQFALGRVLTYGVNWSRPVYDGEREERLGFDVEFRWGE